MKIIIETIPHSEQRYPTVGDWFWNPNQTELTIRVSEECGSWKEQALVAVHELVEVLLCKAQNVSQTSVDQFDFQYEKSRPEGCLDEPGDHPAAPYRRQHCLATAVERLLAAELEVCWKEYEERLEAL